MPFLFRFQKQKYALENFRQVFSYLDYRAYVIPQIDDIYNLIHLQSLNHLCLIKGPFLPFVLSGNENYFCCIQCSESVDIFRLDSSRSSRYKSTRLESKFDLKSTCYKMVKKLRQIMIGRSLIENFSVKSFHLHGD